MKAHVACFVRILAFASAACNAGAFGAGPDASVTGEDAAPILVQAGDGSTCDGTGTPSEDPCVVDNAFGVFVSANGQSGAAGTKDHPLALIADAVKMAVAANKRVYACIGTYDQQLILDASSDGVALYGGLDCTNGWAYVGGAQADAGPDAGTSALATLAPQTTGVVLSLIHI